MGPRKLLLASITTVSIFLHMFPHAHSETDAFPPEAADGPYASGPELSPGPALSVFDVDDYGASAGNDATEVSGPNQSPEILCFWSFACRNNAWILTRALQAFLRAWKEACNSSSDPSLFLVPGGKTYRLMPVSFTGPCRATTITAMVRNDGDQTKPRVVSRCCFFFFALDRDVYLPKCSSDQGDTGGSVEPLGLA